VAPVAKRRGLVKRIRDRMSTAGGAGTRAAAGVVVEPVAPNRRAAPSGGRSTNCCGRRFADAPLVDHFENRLFELATTLMMLGLAIAYRDLAAVDRRQRVPVHPRGAQPGMARHRVLPRRHAAAGGADRQRLWPFYGPILRAIGALSAR
jgi:hypothetical protein